MIRTTQENKSPFLRRIIRENDVVFVWMGFRNKPQKLIVQKNESFSNHNGTFRHDDMIGKAYCSKIIVSTMEKKRKRTKAFIYVLPLSPDIWSISLSHRTQILYHSDIALIISGLDLKGASIVAESGTGSTSLSHAIIRTVSPFGKLYTFEFNEYRVKRAVEDFDINLEGCRENVEIIHQDVIEKGFSTKNNVIFDAIFLDLPEPWLGIHHAFSTLRFEGRLCSFSPCIEQCQRTCMMLKEYNFYHIETIECIPREFRAATVKYPTANCMLSHKTEETIKTGKTTISRPGSRPFSDIAGHSGFLTFATKSYN